MNKLIKVVAASVCAVSLSAVAAEDLEQEEGKAVFEAGFDADFFSAYVWRNAVQNDEMVMQPCVWADLTYFEPFSVGFSIWQNYDLTNRRGETYRKGLDETDYNIHAGVNVWTSEDEEYSLDFELGHDWYTYQGVDRDCREDSPDTREVYAKLTFDNPFVGVYGQASYMYGDFGAYLKAMHYEIGFNKEIEVADSVTLGADWNVNFGDGRYLTYLYGENESGIAGTTVKVYASWALTDWMSLKGTVAYTGLVNGDLRDSIGEQGTAYDFYGDKYDRDIVWGGLSLNVEF